MTLQILNSKKLMSLLSCLFSEVKYQICTKYTFASLVVNLKDTARNIIVSLTLEIIQDKMRTFLALLSTLALASACGEKAAVMQQCLAGTPEFAGRLGAALQACGAVQGADSRIGLMASKCPSSMQIMMKFGMRYRDEICVFQSIGWMDDAGDMIEDVVVADVMTFPGEVQSALAIPNLQACVGSFMDTVMNKPETQECLPTYTEDEMNTINGLAIGAGHIECFVGIFEGACSKYVGC